jgi:hypothetical protein
LLPGCKRSSARSNRSCARIVRGCFVTVLLPLADRFDSQEPRQFPPSIRLRHPIKHPGHVCACPAG